MPLTAHQRLTLLRAGIRIEDDEIDNTFVAILDHPTTADAYDITWHESSCGPVRREDLVSIELPFVAFRAQRAMVFDAPADDLQFEWEVYPLTTEPDEDGIYHVPQLDDRGQEALALLESFIAGLSTPAI